MPAPAERAPAAPARRFADDGPPTDASIGAADRALADTFRKHYARLVAHLTRHLGLGDLHLAEDAVQTALLHAVRRWPLQGRPDNEPAWLFAVARNAAVDQLRRAGREVALEEDPGATAQAACEARPTRFARELDDDELALLAACCAPQLPLPSQVALALKTVCGFGIREIAVGLHASEAAIAQRLARARRALSAPDARTVWPAPAELPQRRDGVLATLQLLFSEGLTANAGTAAQRTDVCREAMRLARAVAAHPATAHADADALAALLLLHGARLPARIDIAGEFVLLAEQDRRRWDPELIALGLAHLQRAMQAARLSRYHLQAGIAAEHACAASLAATNWRRIVEYYKALLELEPAHAVRVGHAVAIAQLHGAQHGLALLQPERQRFVEGRYAIGLVALGDLAAAAADPAMARSEYAAALALLRAPAQRRVVERKRLALVRPPA